MKRSLEVALSLLFLAAAFLGSCARPPKQEVQQGEPLGRLLFDNPVAVSRPGTVDLPRLTRMRGGNTHLVFLSSDTGSQKVMYSRMVRGEFEEPSFLSQDEGVKRGGAFITPRSESEFVAYWVNVPTSGGQLLYKISENGGQTFSIEKRWNNMGDVRSPCVIALGSSIIAYFFANTSDGWQLVANRDFSPERETVIDTPQGIPFNLQGVSDGDKKVYLAYYSRVENSDGGRLAFLTSTDGGNTFERRYLFDDRVIPNMMNFFAIARTVHDRNEIIHLIFTEESPELVTLYYSRSVAGDEFTTPVALFESEERLTNNPLLAANGKYVLVATVDAEVEGPAMRYVFSENGGESFSDPAIATRQVSTPETISGVIDENGNVLIVWDDLAATVPDKEQLFCIKGSLRGQ